MISQRNSNGENCQSYAYQKNINRLFAPVVQVVSGSTRWFFQPPWDNAQYDDNAGIDWQHGWRFFFGAWRNVNRRSLCAADDPYRCLGWNHGASPGRIERFWRLCRLGDRP